MNNTPVNSYRDLIAWQKAMDAVCLTYELTRLLLLEEKYGLTAQMRRCAVSVPSNVAEGWGRQQGADYLRFLFMARGSAFELSTQSEICIRLGFDGQWNRIIHACDEIGRILNGLMAAVQRSLESS